ncbi:hypothetical protein G4G28_10240 [Massilia sp. Dwa41.01b]|uniref:hypothetical protein n=1 Tax=Massilia sp. Dwa41.01b TaxID=2709302 RepID=UPI0015FF9DBE|nr:hypothetical protein [Massilia sp. Dwa41.01b]QNA88780.1 hypothetical protein G4G28_10240 [Massilia sp. Dwa41.01b]
MLLRELLGTHIKASILIRPQQGNRAQQSGRNGDGQARHAWRLPPAHFHAHFAVVAAHGAVFIRLALA